MSTYQATTGQLRPDGSKNSRITVPHPLDQLSVAECEVARRTIVDSRGGNVAIQFRSIALEEPLKNELCQFLEIEHSDRLTAQTPRPARLAKVQYDVVRGNKEFQYTESWVNVVSGEEVRHRVVDKVYQAPLIM